MLQTSVNGHIVSFGCCGGECNLLTPDATAGSKAGPLALRPRGRKCARADRLADGSLQWDTGGVWAPFEEGPKEQQKKLIPHSNDDDKDK